MSINNNTLNFVIHDANGLPQLVKVLNNINKQASLQTKPTPLIVLPKSEAKENPVYQTVKITNIKCTTRLVELPLETIACLEKSALKTQPIETLEIETPEEDLEVQLESTPEPALSVTLESSETSINEDIPRMSHASRKRHETDDHPPEYTTKRRKHADKVGKGLRHFSMKVCEKVRTKGFTSYNEVADELVLEFAAGMHGTADSQQYDQKNIRRRVYDALNVLMAMNIISKEKKEIRWLGLPTNSIQECNALEKEKQQKLEEIQKKTQQLNELILQHISFKSLIERNKEAENKGIKPSPSSAIHLPFIVVNTSDKALIDCSISNDKTEYMFNFNKRFQIHDDIDILKRMGLLFGLDKGECSEEDIERAKSMVPKSLEYYVEQMARGVNTNLSTMLEEEEQLEEVGEEEEETLECEVDEDQDTNDYSEDSSDVDV